MPEANDGIGVRGTMVSVEDKVYDYVVKIRIGDKHYYFAAYPHKRKKGDTKKVSRLQLLADHDGLVDEKTKKEMEALGL